MTESHENLSITFNFAAAFDDPEAIAGEAFLLHRKILDGLPPFPVLLLKKERADFTPENCIVAVAGGKVVGCALLNPCGAIETLAGKIASKLGAEAARKTREVCGAFNQTSSIYELGALCVDPVHRRCGIGQQFYQLAAAQTGGNVFAVVTEDNAISRAAALRAGYAAAPDSAHAVRFGQKDGYAVPDIEGPHVVRAALFRPRLGAALSAGAEKACNGL